jgi:hypothetical protein
MQFIPFGRFGAFRKLDEIFPSDQRLSQGAHPRSAILILLNFATVIEGAVRCVRLAR